MTAGRHTGWFLLAFASELGGALTPVAVGDTRLVVVRDGRRTRVVDADCPHRGAHLGLGRLDGDRIVCPFHGHRVGIGPPGGGSGSCRFRVREHPSLLVGDLLLVRLGDGHEHGLGARLTELDRTHYVVTGFTMPVRAEAHWVVENGLDDAHFREVHGIGTRPGLDVTSGADGELVAAGTFTLPRPAGSGPGPQRSGPVQVGYEARVYSPWLIVSRVGGTQPYTVLTGATPRPGGGCEVRLALAAPAGPGGPPDREWCREILRNSRDGLERDRDVWEHLAPSAAWDPTPEDAPVQAFRAFCRTFGHDPDRSAGLPRAVLGTA